jgi:lipid-A-disaccharide synthase
MEKRLFQLHCLSLKRYKAKERHYTKLSSKKSVMIVAGEASGDVYGAQFVYAMRDLDPDITFYGIGGAKMELAGVRVLHDASLLSVVGFAELLPRIRYISRVLKELKQLLKRSPPDLLVLIDYPGFNLNLAKRAHALDIPVFYYIPPQLWAWREGRVKKIAQRVNRVAVILPFEEEFYLKHGLEVEYVGHPLLDVPPSRSKEEIRNGLSISPEFDPILALLPGSRAEEIHRLMPAMVDAAKIISRSYPRLCCVLPLASTVNEDLVNSYLKDATIDIRVAGFDSKELLSIADLAFIASGTATLEAAITETPMVITYKVSPFSYILGRYLAKVSFIGLVNLVAGRAIAPELIQGNATASRLAEEGLTILEDERVRGKMISDLQLVKERLGRSGASRGAASIAKDMMDLETQSD